MSEARSDQLAMVHGGKIVCGYRGQWTFNELLADELTQAVMLADHVDATSVERLVSLMMCRRERNRLDAAPQTACTMTLREVILSAL